MSVGRGLYVRRGRVCRRWRVCEVNRECVYREGACQNDRRGSLYRKVCLYGGCYCGEEVFV